jgi:hypothetical protein
LYTAGRRSPALKPACHLHRLACPAVFARHSRHEENMAHLGTNASTQGAQFQEQDPNRRLGDFEGAGEHSFQQPGGRNDANH